MMHFLYFSQFFLTKHKKLVCLLTLFGIIFQVIQVVFKLEETYEENTLLPLKVHNIIWCSFIHLISILPVFFIFTISPPIPVVLPPKMVSVDTQTDYVEAVVSIEPEVPE